MDFNPLKVFPTNNLFDILSYKDNIRDIQSDQATDKSNPEGNHNSIRIEHHFKDATNSKPKKPPPLIPPCTY